MSSNVSGVDLSEYDLYEYFFGLLGRFRGAHIKLPHQCKLWPVSLTLIGDYIATVLTAKSMQHFKEQAQTELTINLTEKVPKGKRSKVWLYFAQKDSNNATCSKCNTKIACKGGRQGKSQRQI